MLTCPKCGFDNELGRIFCHQCGQKLDLNQIKAPIRGGKSLRRRRGPSVRDIVRWVLELAALAAVVYGIYLMVQVPPTRAITTTGDDLLRVNQKRLQMQRLMDQKQPAAIALTEGELNAYLERLGFEKAEGKPITVDVKSLQMELSEGVVTVVVNGQLKLSSLFNRDLAIRYTVVPAFEHNMFTPKPVAGSIGELPIHPWILENLNFMRDYFGQILKNLTDDKQLLDKLSSITVSSQRVQLSYLPPKPTD